MAKNKVLGVNEDKLEAANVIMDVVAHELRLEIIHYLLEKGEAIVGDIYRHLDITQSMTSQHLKELRDIKVVNVRAQHKHRFYSINYEKLQHIKDLVSEFFPS